MMQGTVTKGTLHCSVLIRSEVDANWSMNSHHLRHVSVKVPVFCNNQDETETARLKKAKEELNFKEKCGVVGRKSGAVFCMHSPSADLKIWNATQKL